MKLKRVLSVFIAAVLFVVQFNFLVSAEDKQEDISVPSAVLMEASTGNVLYEKNSHEQRPCASITKVMTLLLVMEALDKGQITLDTPVTASAHAASMGGSDIWLKEGETMSVDDMLKATVIASANDAAVALAELVSGSEDRFVEEMNKRAKELGMNDTTFLNCNGLDEDGHVSSAYDVALMSRELIKHKKIFDYTGTWIDNIRDGKTQLVNTNKLLKTYKGITGLKTGTTSKAGSCISATAEKNGMSLIAVALGAESTALRFQTAAKLLDIGFAGWKLIQIDTPQDIPQNIPVTNGMENSIGITLSPPDSVLIKSGEDSNIVTKIDLPDSIDAPVSLGEQVGIVEYLINDKVVAQSEIFSLDKAERITFNEVLKRLFDIFICKKSVIQE